MSVVVTGVDAGEGDSAVLVSVVVTGVDAGEGYSAVLVLVSVVVTGVDAGKGGGRWWRLALGAFLRRSTFQLSPL